MESRSATTSRIVGWICFASPRKKDLRASLPKERQVRIRLADAHQTGWKSKPDSSRNLWSVDSPNAKEATNRQKWICYDCDSSAEGESDQNEVESARSCIPSPALLASSWSLPSLISGCDPHKNFKPPSGISAAASGWGGDEAERWKHFGEDTARIRELALETATKRLDQTEPLNCRQPVSIWHILSVGWGKDSVLGFNELRDAILAF